MAALLSLILDCFSEKKQPKTVLDAAKAMVDSSQTPIVLCDAKDGTIVHCNGACRRPAAIPSSKPSAGRTKNCCKGLILIVTARES